MFLYTNVYILFNVNEYYVEKLSSRDQQWAAQSLEMVAQSRCNRAAYEVRALVFPSILQT